MQFHGRHIKPVYLRVLGSMGLAGAPWILIDFIENGLYDRFRSTSAGGVHNLLFMTGCMCSVLALYYINATGTNRAGKLVMIVQLVLLGIANCWNIYMKLCSPLLQRLSMNGWDFPGLLVAAF